MTLGCLLLDQRAVADPIPLLISYLSTDIHPNPTDIHRPSSSRDLMLSGNIGHYEKLFDDQRFYRTHQSHLINLHHLRKYVKTEGGYFVMADDSQIPISRLKKEEVKRLLH